MAKDKGKKKDKAEKAEKSKKVETGTIQVANGGRQTDAIKVDEDHAAAQAIEVMEEVGGNAEVIGHGMKLFDKSGVKLGFIQTPSGGGAPLLYVNLVSAEKALEVAPEYGWKPYTKRDDTATLRGLKAFDKKLVKALRACVEHRVSKKRGRVAAEEQVEQTKSKKKVKKAA